MGRSAGTAAIQIPYLAGWIYNDLVEKDSYQVPFLTLAISLAILAGLLIFLARHLGDLRGLIVLFGKARFDWILIGALIQALTYVLRGGVWYLVAALSRYRIRLQDATLLVMEQFAIDQLVPMGGIAGNTLIIRSMKRLGVPLSLATETVLVGILSYHLAYSLVTAAAVTILWFYGGITPIVSAIVSAYFLISTAVTVVTLLLTFNKTEKVPKWLKQREFVKTIRGVLEDISPERVLSKALLAKTSMLRVLVFVLNAVTLNIVMISIGVPVSFTAALVATIIGSIAATVTFLPGGIGSYEIASIGALALFGVPADAALAGTLLLRGLTLWLPLVPGIYLARHHVSFKLS